MRADASRSRCPVLRADPNWNASHSHRQHAESGSRAKGPPDIAHRFVRVGSALMEVAAAANARRNVPSRSARDEILLGTLGSGRVPARSRPSLTPSQFGTELPFLRSTLRLAQAHICFRVRMDGVPLSIEKKFTNAYFDMLLALSPIESDHILERVFSKNQRIGKSGIWRGSPITS